MTIDNFLDLVKKGELQVVKEQLSFSPNLINQKDGRGFPPLVMAAYYEQIPVLNYLIEQGAEINQADTSGNTALMGACFKGFFLTVVELINAGANVNAQNLNGATALTFAYTFNQMQIAELLLKNGADKTLRDYRGKSPEDHARAQGLTV